MDRYDDFVTGFTLRKNIRDSRTDEEPRPHSSTRLLLALVLSNAKRLVPSLRHRGILCRQGCTPMKAAHPFSCTPVQLHTHKDTHSFNCTAVAKVQDWSGQNVTRLTALTVNPNWQKFFFRKREKAKSISFFYKKKSLQILFLYPISILSRKVKHNGSIHKYAQLVMLTHYSPLRGWLPSVTLGHKHNQTLPIQRQQFFEALVCTLWNMSQSESVGIPWRNTWHRRIWGTWFQTCLCHHGASCRQGCRICPLSSRC